MQIKKFLGGIFIFISMFLSIGNIFSSKITGAVIGSDLKSSLVTLLTFMFFVMGLIFMSNLEKKVQIGLKQLQSQEVLLLQAFLYIIPEMKKLIKELKMPLNLKIMLE